jgi:hypothetical protein
MSLNSLQDRMEQRAASMAQMAKRANNPQDIQAMQQRLTTEIQNGTIKPYIGIPLIQELTKRLGEAKAKAAMNVMGAPAQGGAPAAPAAPIAQQVMQQATQESQGVEALPSNLPESYAGGGIIAFANGGEAEEPLRFQNEGVVPSELKYKDWSSLPPARDGGGPFFSGDVGAKIGTALEQGKRRIDPISGESITYGQFLRNQEKERTGAAPLAGSTPVLDSRGATFSGMQGGTNLPTTFAPPPVVNAGGGGGGGGGKTAPITLPTANLGTPPTVTSFKDFMGDLPKKISDEAEKAVNARKTELEKLDNPLFKAQEDVIAKREGRIAQDSKVAGLMALARAGLKTAAGTSRNALQNIATGLEGGLDDLIKAEAAKRAAMERAEDARMNLTAQKNAAAKGNITAADTAGERAANNMYRANQLTTTAKHYDDTAKISLFGIESQRGLGKAQLEQQGILGLENLKLQKQQLGQTGSYQQAALAQQGDLARQNLAMQERRFNAMDKASQARLQQVKANASKDFTINVAPQLNAQFTKEYGPNWRTAQDARSLQAQMLFTQQQDAYVSQATGQAMDVLGARQADTLLFMGQ